MSDRPSPWKVALLIEMSRPTPSGGVPVGKTVGLWCYAMLEACESLDAMKRGEVDWAIFDVALERLTREDGERIAAIHAEYPLEADA